MVLIGVGLRRRRRLGRRLGSIMTLRRRLRLISVHDLVLVPSRRAVPDHQLLSLKLASLLELGRGELLLLLVFVLAFGLRQKVRLWGGGGHIGGGSLLPLFVRCCGGGRSWGLRQCGAVVDWLLAFACVCVCGCRRGLVCGIRGVGRDKSRRYGVGLHAFGVAIFDYVELFEYCSSVGVWVAGPLGSHCRCLAPHRRRGFLPFLLVWLEV
mmetsp:Transcript_25970/g.78114  ORF Transcript_25970/g.78114 Transcript_25970/m.78114 type:complete len:210 (+) Transcript_25970:406-1035(+)